MYLGELINLDGGLEDGDRTHANLGGGQTLPLRTDGPSASKYSYFNFIVTYLQLKSYSSLEYRPIHVA